MYTMEQRELDAVSQEGAPQVVVVITKQNSPKNRTLSKEVRVFPDEDAADAWVDADAETQSEHEQLHTEHVYHTAPYLTGPHQEDT